MTGIANQLNPFQFFHPTTHLPLEGGWVYSYSAGSNTPATMYASANKESKLPNPIELSASGSIRTGIWGDDTYKIVVKSADKATTIWTIDNYILGSTDLVIPTTELSVSSNTLSGTTDINLQTGAAGTYQFKSTSSQSAQLRFYEDTDNGTNYITVAPAASVTGNYTTSLSNGQSTFKVAQVVKTEVTAFTSVAFTGNTQSVNDSVLSFSNVPTQTLISAFTTAITPKSATNLLYITVDMSFSYNVNDGGTISHSPFVLSLGVLTGSGTTIVSSIPVNFTAYATALKDTHNIRFSGWITASDTSSVFVGIVPTATGSTSSRTVVNGSLNGSSAGAKVSSLTIIEYTP